MVVIRQAAGGAPAPSGAAARCAASGSRRCAVPHRRRPRLRPRSLDAMIPHHRRRRTPSLRLRIDPCRCTRSTHPVCLVLRQAASASRGWECVSEAEARHLIRRPAGREKETLLAEIAEYSERGRGFKSRGRRCIRSTGHPRRGALARAASCPSANRSTGASSARTRPKSSLFWPQNVRSCISLRLRKSPTSCACLDAELALAAKHLC